MPSRSVDVRGEFARGADSPQASFELDLRGVSALCRDDVDRRHRPRHRRAERFTFALQIVASIATMREMSLGWWLHTALLPRVRDDLRLVARLRATSRAWRADIDRYVSKHWLGTYAIPSIGVHRKTTLALAKGPGTHLRRHVVKFVAGERARARAGAPSLSIARPSLRLAQYTASARCVFCDAVLPRQHDRVGVIHGVPAHYVCWLAMSANPYRCDVPYRFATSSHRALVAFTHVLGAQLGAVNRRVRDATFAIGRLRGAAIARQGRIPLDAHWALLPPATASHAARRLRREDVVEIRCGIEHARHMEARTRDSFVEAEREITRVRTLDDRIHAWIYGRRWRLALERARRWVRAACIVQGAPGAPLTPPLEHIAQRAAATRAKRSEVWRAVSELFDGTTAV